MTESSNSKNIVQLEDVTLKDDRGGYVFRGLNLTIDSGQTVIVCGSSGAGKTLLAELLVGLRIPERGVIRLFGEEFRPKRKRSVRKARRLIGGVGGPFELLPSLNVTENITLPLVIAGDRKKLQKERLLRSLSEFSLLKLAGHYPSELTRVENSMVQFARASVANQPLMIVDEPLSGLDPKTYRRVSESLIKISLSGRSLLMLVSDTPSNEFPDAKLYHLEDGVLQ